MVLLYFPLTLPWVHSLWLGIFGFTLFSPYLTLGPFPLVRHLWFYFILGPWAFSVPPLSFGSGAPGGLVKGTCDLKSNNKGRREIQPTPEKRRETHRKEQHTETKRMQERKEARSALTPFIYEPSPNQKPASKGPSCPGIDLPNDASL